jgi:hypothetical protein
MPTFRRNILSPSSWQGFSPEDGDSMFLRNVGIYWLAYTAPKPRRTWSSHHRWLEYYQHKEVPCWLRIFQQGISQHVLRIKSVNLKTETFPDQCVFAVFICLWSYSTSSMLWRAILNHSVCRTLTLKDADTGLLVKWTSLSMILKLSKSHCGSGEYWLGTVEIEKEMPS